MSRLDLGDEGCRAWIQERRAPCMVLRAPWVTLALGALRPTATIGSGQEGCPGRSADPRSVLTVGAAGHRFSAGADRPSVLTGPEPPKRPPRLGLCFSKVRRPRSKSSSQAQRRHSGARTTRSGLQVTAPSVLEVIDLMDLMDILRSQGIRLTVLRRRPGRLLSRRPVRVGEPLLIPHGPTGARIATCLSNGVA
jgi:hypothetical protein